MKKSETIVSQGLIDKSFEYRVRNISFDSGQSTQIIDVTADGAPLFSGRKRGSYIDNDPILEMSVSNQEQDYLSASDYLKIFAVSAVAMGTSLTRVRPALHLYDENAPHAPIALSALNKMKMALGRN